MKDAEAHHIRHQQVDADRHQSAYHGQRDVAAMLSDILFKTDGLVFQARKAKASRLKYKRR